MFLYTLMGVRYESKEKYYTKKFKKPRALIIIIQQHWKKYQTS